MDDDRARLPEQRVITDLDALKVMANPLRVRLLQMLADRASSVKELATQLDEGPTKLYRHIEQMARHGFIEVVSTRAEGGPEQRRYRATARSFVLDTSIFHDDEPLLGEVLSFVFDTTRADIRARVRDGTIDLGRRAPQPRSLLARRCLLHLDSAQAEHYYRTLAQLAVDVTDGSADEDARQGYALAVALYPTEPESTEPEPT